MITTLLTYCTPDYQKIYDEHIGPCIKVLGLKPHNHYERKPDNWAAITRLKPGIILEELKRGNPVLYVDCDAEITSKEVMNIDNIVPQDYIAAVAFLNHYDWCRGDASRNEPMTGTLFFRPSAIPLIEKWVKLCEAGDLPDNKYFEQLVNFETKGVFHLDIKWSYINSLPGGSKGLIPCGNPLIIHFQASREMRNK